MVKGRLVDLDVLGTLIENVIIDDYGVLYSLYDGRGRPSTRAPSEQVKTKTLQKLMYFEYLLRKAKLNPTKMSQSILADIFQAKIGGSRQTAMDYAKTIIYLYCFVNERAPHYPKIIEKQ